MLPVVLIPISLLPISDLVVDCSGCGCCSVAESLLQRSSSCFSLLFFLGCLAVQLHVDSWRELGVLRGKSEKN
ncbi:hypothetical protein ACJW31_07G049200 [Castanea mollissima]